MNIDLKKLFENGNVDSNERMRNTLITAIKKNAQPDFDYLKFKQSVAAMRDMDIDEETSIKSAFATASVMGLTKEKLLKSANHYKVVLTKEREEFARALKNQIAENVDGRRVEAKRLVKEIEQHKAEIAELEKMIRLKQDKIDQVESIVTKANTKIVNTRDNFKETFDNLYEQINDDIITIDKYL